MTAFRSRWNRALRCTFPILAVALPTEAFATEEPSNPIVIAPAAEPAPAPLVAVASESASSYPKLGGHWGIVVPIVNFGNTGVTTIGKDFLQVGIAPGVTLKLDKHWAIDFEFIGFSRYEFAHNGFLAQSSTLFVVDPGLLYNFGAVTVGLRTAVQIGDQMNANAGLVPILNKSFSLGRVAWFVELDFPVFLYAEPTRTTASFTPIVHTGFGF